MRSSKGKFAKLFRNVPTCTETGRKSIFMARSVLNIKKSDVIAKEYRSVFPITRVRTVVKVGKIGFLFLLTDFAQIFRIGLAFDPLQKVSSLSRYFWRYRLNTGPRFRHRSSPVYFRSYKMAQLLKLTKKILPLSARLRSIP